MRLTTVERERMTDSLLKIQSARENLNQIDSDKIPSAEEVAECLETADKSLKEALGYAQPKLKPCQ
ncbi:MAG TPA: hypothetical protein VGL72_13780 [Bryobacteraceae bacterium]|jgi:hypothetical protein